MSLAPQWPSSLSTEPHAIGPWSQTAAEFTTLRSPSEVTCR